MAPDTNRVTVVGGGLAGMRCAELLSHEDISVTLIEKQSRLGGRVQTDEIDGFLVDRGFQVLLTGYPEAREALDFSALNLKSFDPGAILRYDGDFHRVSDPFRKPKQLIETLRSPVGGLADKLRILRMRTALSSLSEEELFARKEMTTLDALRQRWGFSREAIERFFSPFFGGILLEPSLRGSSRMTEYVFALFSRGDATVPAGGMGQIAAQMSSRLSSVDVRLNTTVRSLSDHSVILDDGSAVDGDAVVVAVEGTEANRLLGQGTAPEYVATHCHYFAAEHAPLSEAALVLNGEGTGPINNLSVITNVSPDYSATGEALVSVTVLDDPARSTDTESESRVRDHLTKWFGPAVQRWRHVRSYHIAAALPDQRPPFLSPPEKDVRAGDGVYRCGDYLDTASINGALRSGRRAAETLIADLSGARA